LKRFDRVEIPGEHEARERAWQLVQAAYAEREPVPRQRRRARPALALGLAAALAAVAFTPPGRAVVETVRDAIGIESAEEALFSLPVPGRLLVVSGSGAWAVGEDGSTRRLGDYLDAGCSPFGRFVAAAGPNELVALEPDGDVRWKLSRPAVRGPRWGGTLTDTRIAYVSRGAVHVVAGDGTNDRRLTAGRAAAWRPGSVRLLAVATAGVVSLFDLQRGQALWTANVQADSLAWSADGTRLLALRAGRYALISAAGEVVAGGASLSGAFGPHGHALAVVRRTATGSELVVGGRLRFQGTGTFRDATWSPDGRWLAVSWPEADQLVFVRAAGPRKIQAAANLSRQFESTTFPRLAGWCPLP
jgi:WD40 repeat protein